MPYIMSVFVLVRPCISPHRQQVPASCPPIATFLSTSRYPFQDNHRRRIHFKMCKFLTVTCDGAESGNERHRFTLSNFDRLPCMQPRRKTGACYDKLELEYPNYEVDVLPCQGKLGHQAIHDIKQYLSSYFSRTNV